MGLKFADAASWQRWQASRRRLPVLKDRVLNRSAQEPTFEWWIRGDDPRLLVACDSNSPTNQHTLLAPLEAAPALDAVVVQPAGWDLGLPAGWRRLPDPAAMMSAIRAVATIGDHLAAGAWAHAEARRRGWRQFVVQHGLLTAFSPPPPPGVELLAWSAQDADFWAAGRADLGARSVGSALLAAAAAARARHVSRFERPVFLGQLHGAELSRASMARSVTAFWRETGCRYRPHPREEDRLSRVQHRIWQRMGMQFDDSASLTQLAHPVVSAFSTGVLEAAASGLPAWVYHVAPPLWLAEVWERYDLARWGAAPTRTADWGGEPAARVAAIWADTDPR